MTRRLYVAVRFHSDEEWRDIILSVVDVDGSVHGLEETSKATERFRETFT